MERQIDGFLAALTIGDDFLEWALGYVWKLHETEVVDRKAVYGSVESAYRSAQRQIDELLNVRLR